MAAPYSQFRPWNPSVDGWPEEKAVPLPHSPEVADVAEYGDGDVDMANATLLGEGTGPARGCTRACRCGPMAQVHLGACTRPRSTSAPSQ